jgi:Protein of unknown function (DUF1353)
MTTYIYRSPIITNLNDHEFTLVEPFVFEWDEPQLIPMLVQPYRITIPKGYPFDGASVPRLCWTLTGLLPTGVHLGASAVHDWAYQRRGHLVSNEVERWNGVVWEPVAVVWTRKQCDEMFLRIMRDAGETAWKASAMFWAVRVFGGAAWDR